jgi:hypothetical protein
MQTNPVLSDPVEPEDLVKGGLYFITAPIIESMNSNAHSGSTKLAILISEPTRDPIQYKIINDNNNSANAYYADIERLDSAYQSQLPYYRFNKVYPPDYSDARVRKVREKYFPSFMGEPGREADAVVGQNYYFANSKSGPYIRGPLLSKRTNYGEYTIQYGNKNKNSMEGRTRRQSYSGPPGTIRRILPAKPGTNLVFGRVAEGADLPNNVAAHLKTFGGGRRASRKKLNSHRRTSKSRRRNNH